MSVLEGPWKHEYIISNGVKLHYVTQGEGPLMLMLHGFPEFWYSWRHQIPEFAKDHKVVALDLRGYNDSDKPQDAGSYSMDELLLDVEGVLQGLGYDRCILVGHDWGGAIAWCFASVYPQYVEKLIILNMPHPAKFRQGLRTLEQLQRSWYVFLFQLPWVPEFLLEWGSYRAIGTMLRETAVQKEAFSAQDLEAYKDAAAKRGALTAMLNYYRNLFPGMLEQEWEPITVPTLLIWGESDVALNKDLTYGTEAYVPNLRIHYIANSGHWVQQEQPQLVNQYMREFV
uniref:Alpha/beta hydrolase fold protein n=1 Tax=Cyanothece sp. (strain PCC 7425 / ATCC 29141) TaxID=395961 RepID=B8HRV1_CYAP4